MPEKNYLNEIEEILERAEANGPPRTNRLRLSILRCFSRLRVPPLSRFRITPGKAVIAGIVLLLLALPFRAFLSAATTPLIWAGLGMFVAAYVLFLFQPRTAKREKRWRGQVIEDQPESPWKRLRRIFKGK